jgi:hypothetical protein
MSEASTNDKVQHWKQAVDRIASLYAGVERRTLTLPGFSLAPTGTYLWALTKFSLFLQLDLFLLVPMNCVIAIRNAFPGKWAYRSFSAKYFRAAVQWIKNGEIPLPASIVIRSLTSALLSWHFHGRLADLRRRVIVDNDLDPDGRAVLTAEIDRLLVQWPAPKLVQGLFAYALPLMSPLAAFYQMVVPSAPAIWTRLIVLVSLSYALGVVASAFVVKRGLMLGGEGRAAYFPGFLEGNGAYATERELLAMFGISRSEFPLAYALTLLLAPVQLFQAIYIYDSGIYATIAGQAAFSKTAVVVQSMVAPILFAALGAVALMRQNKLRRS